MSKRTHLGGRSSSVHSRVLYRGERCERDGTNTSLSVPSHYLWPFTIGEKSFVATIGEKSANMEMLIGNKKNPISTAIFRIPVRNPVEI